jgi:hypothetical protein
LSEGILTGITVGIGNPQDNYSNWDIGGNIGFILNKKKKIQFPIIGHLGYLSQKVGDDNLSGPYFSGIAECSILPNLIILK